MSAEIEKLKVGDKIYKVGTELGGIVKSVNAKTVKIQLLGTGKVIKVKKKKVRLL